MLEILLIFLLILFLVGGFAVSHLIWLLILVLLAFWLFGATPRRR